MGTRRLNDRRLEKSVTQLLSQAVLHWLQSTKMGAVKVKTWHCEEADTIVMHSQ